MPVYALTGTSALNTNLAILKGINNMQTAKEITFDIFQPSDRSAGINQMSDTVHVTIESGDPGGTPGEFEQYLKEALEKWYPDAEVTELF